MAVAGQIECRRSHINHIAACGGGIIVTYLVLNQIRYGLSMTYKNIASRMCQTHSNGLAGHFMQILHTTEYSIEAATRPNLYIATQRVNCSPPCTPNWQLPLSRTCAAKLASPFLLEPGCKSKGRHSLSSKIPSTYTYADQKEGSGKAERGKRQQD